MATKPRRSAAKKSRSAATSPAKSPRKRKALARRPSPGMDPRFPGLPPNFPVDCGDPLIGQMARVRQCFPVPGKKRPQCETRSHTVIACATPAAGKRARQMTLAPVGGDPAAYFAGTSKTPPVQYAVPAREVMRDLGHLDAARGRAESYIDCEAQLWRAGHGYPLAGEAYDACTQLPLTEPTHTGPGDFDFPTLPNTKQARRFVVWRDSTTGKYSGQYWVTDSWKGPVRNSAGLIRSSHGTLISGPYSSRTEAEEAARYYEREKEAQGSVPMPGWDGPHSKNWMRDRHAQHKTLMAHLRERPLLPNGGDECARCGQSVGRSDLDGDHVCSFCRSIRATQRKQPKITLSPGDKVRIRMGREGTKTGTVIYAINRGARGRNWGWYIEFRRDGDGAPFAWSQSTSGDGNGIVERIGGPGNTSILGRAAARVRNFRATRDYNVRPNPGPSYSGFPSMPQSLDEERAGWQRYNAAEAARAGERKGAYTAPAGHYHTPHRREMVQQPGEALPTGNRPGVRRQAAPEQTAITGDHPAIGRVARGEYYAGRVVAKTTLGGKGNLLVGVTTMPRSRVEGSIKREWGQFDQFPPYIDPQVGLAEMHARIVGLEQRVLRAPTAAKRAVAEKLLASARAKHAKFQAFYATGG